MLICSIIISSFGVKYTNLKKTEIHMLTLSEHLMHVLKILYNNILYSYFKEGTINCYLILLCVVGLLMTIGDDISYEGDFIYFVGVRLQELPGHAECLMLFC